MNEQAFLHIPDSRYCFAVSQREVVLRLRVAKNEKIKAITAVYGGKYNFAIKRTEKRLEKTFTDNLFDFYTVHLNLTDLRLVYIFCIETDNGKLYYSEDGLTKQYNYAYGFYNFFQLPYINQADLHEVVEWTRSAVFYQIFVDRFNIGRLDKDMSYVNLKWGSVPTPKSFAGGDLKGITEKIDYINSLGANTIYLTPVFRSVSNHKYDISDYYEVDSQFGTNADLKELIDKAHDRGMKVVLDAVFNHCSEKSVQFKDCIKNGKNSKYFDWFMIDGDKVDRKKVNYECFGACSYMPRFNTSNKKVQEYLINIALYYIKEFDIDGWRLDVSDEVAHDFWRKFRTAVKSAKSDCVIIGENWHDAYPYLQGDQYDSIMNYTFTKACLDFYAFGNFTADDFSNKLNNILMRNTDTVNAMMLNLLDSHDTHRFLSETGGDCNKLLSALAVTVFFLGAPCIYYGTEICMKGGYDPDCRRTFDWNSIEKHKDFTENLKKLLAYKKREELMYGDIKIYSEDGKLVIKRSYGKKTLTLYADEKGLQIKNGEKDEFSAENLYMEKVLKTAAK